MKSKQAIRPSFLSRKMWTLLCAAGWMIVILVGCGATVDEPATPAVFIDTPTLLVPTVISQLEASVISTKTIAGVTESSTPEATALKPSAKSAVEAAATPTPSPTSEPILETAGLPSEVSLTDITPSAASYVKQQIALPIGGGGDPFEFYIDPANLPTQPILMSQDNVPSRQSFGIWTSALYFAYICGYSPNETLSIRLLDPANQEVFTATAQTLTVSAWLEPEVKTDCFRVTDVGSQRSRELLPGSPLGEYAIEVTGIASRITIPFELVLSYSPEIFWSTSLKSYVLAGFDPSEEIVILVFQEDPQPTPQPGQWQDRRGSLIGSLQLTANQDGVGIIDASGFGEFVGTPRPYLFALGNRGHYASYESVWPSVDYFAMVAAEPTNPVAWYMNGMHGRGEDREGAFNDLTRAIELAPDNAELYLARASRAMTRGDALADLTQAIELKPDHAEAYLQRAGLWEAGIDPEDRQNAIADYERVLDLTFNPSTKYYVQQLLDELRP